MNKSIFFMLLLPLLAIAQNKNEYMVFEDALLTPNPEKISQFEKGVAAHNKKYHAGYGPYGARVYWVNNGKDTGSYNWIMGPFPWSAIDERPTSDDGHDTDWDTTVMPYVTAESGDQTYWKFNSEISHFPIDFTQKNLLVDYYDVNRGKMADALKLVEKINKVYVDKLPDETYGIYTNEFSSTKEGRDLAIISFFDKSSWLGENNGVDKKFDEVYGAGSWDQFLIDWTAITASGETELWSFRPDLSGNIGESKATPRK